MFQDRDGFYCLVRPYLDNGILKEIYSSDDFAIFNVADQCYIVTNYLCSNKNDFMMCFANKNLIMKILNDKSYFVEYLSGLNSFYFNKLVYFSHNGDLSLFDKCHAKNLTSGPYLRTIDYNMETMIKENYGSIGRKK